MEQFKDNSIICEYQMIIPMHPHARLELQDPVEVPEYKVGENRQGGLWSPKESQSLWDQLINARFVHEVAWMTLSWDSSNDVWLDSTLIW